MATIHCGVADDGSLTGCEVLSQSPADSGFGEAALALSAKIKAVVGAGLRPDVTLPVRFVPPATFVEPIFKRGTRGFFGGAGPYYPERAFRMALGGSATLACKLAVDGRLNDCTAVSEEPPGQNFSDAALSMALRGWMTRSRRSLMDDLSRMNR